MIDWLADVWSRTHVVQVVEGGEDNADYRWPAQVRHPLRREGRRPRGYNVIQ
ncbi:hypothetical protein ABGB16_11675 [Micromonospora sp. B11E3]|uniref:hypothetical protein n=1 Tax=Micromonospora sp. B11E3 TaxID=3153562 RepID=UPI00325D79D3